jgi:DNA-damage-inducible protein J
MRQTNIQIRIDEDLKNSFVKLCDDLGLTVTTACCAFIRKAVAEQRIPFELSVTQTKRKDGKKQ